MRIQTIRALFLLGPIALVSTSACTDDAPGDELGDTTGDGDGDPTTGDGDGDPTTGDGDGDPTTGDGDGDPTTGDGDGDPTTGDGDGDGELVRFTVDDAAAGSAWVTIADITGDGQLDLVVSRFGSIGGFSIPNGDVVLYTRTGGLGDWQATTLISDQENIKFPNQTSAHDFDGDGDLDILVPYGFLACAAAPPNTPCGGLLWLEQTQNGWTKHDIVQNGATLFYHHGEWVDFDGDGVEDLVTVGEEGPALLGGDPGQAQAQWFKGTGAGFETTPRAIGAGLGSLPTVLDLDGDGDLDVASAQYFDESASFAWFERTADPSQGNPNGSFVHHIIDDQVGPSIQLSFIDDFHGDGKLVAVGSNHTNTNDDANDPESGIYTYEIPADPKQEGWTRKKISTGIVSEMSPLFGPQGAPGIFGAGDIDGDGDLDLFVSGDGDKKVYWVEQAAPGAFVTRIVENPLGQAGGMKFADLDGNGTVEAVVTGYEANVVYIYTWQ